MRPRAGRRGTILVLLLLSAGGGAGCQPASEARAADTPRSQIAIFAGGCYWCMEPPFENVKGVLSVTAGFASGEELPGAPREAVVIRYDPGRIRYEQLLEVFWKNVDPTDNEGQFCDRGAQYRSAIYYHSDAQRTAAIASRNAVRPNSDLGIATEIARLSKFENAPAYDQNYADRNPVRYKFYRYGCGRDQRLRQVWKERSKEEG